MLEIFNIVVILVAGLMVGSELGIAAFVHPTLYELADEVHLPAASALARVLGKLMPSWYALTFLLTAVEAGTQWRQSGLVPVWTTASAALWMLAILYSIIALVPINKRIESAAPSSDWKSDRRRWDGLHRWRVGLLAMALVFLIVGLSSR